MHIHTNLFMLAVMIFFITSIIFPYIIKIQSNDIKDFPGNSKFPSGEISWDETGISNSVSVQSRKKCLFN